MVEEADPHEHGKMVHKFAGFEQVSKGQLRRRSSTPKSPTWSPT
jgi:hypothetical protein